MNFLGAGRALQTAIFSRGVSGLKPAVPTNAVDLEKAASRKMSAAARAYVLGGAGDEKTMQANRAALDRVNILPTMLRDSTSRSTEVELFAGTKHAQKLPAPVMVAPVGAAGLVKRNADTFIGEASAALGIPYIFSSQGSVPMEDVAAAMDKTNPAAPRWFQLYWSNDEQLVESFVRRAESVNAGAIVLTVDTTHLGWRPRDLNLGYLPFTRGIGIAQYTSDPRFRELVAGRLASGKKIEKHIADGAEAAEFKPRPTPAAIATLLNITRNHPGTFLDNLRSPVPREAVQTFLDTYSNPALSWEQVAKLKTMTDLPVVIKGLCTPDDAVRAFEADVDAVMVSNHGGRQVDGAVSSLDSLVAIRAAVGEDATLLFDSGIRNGSDVFKALACGADAVTVGRPSIYGLALDGARGVEAVLRNIIGEFDLTMALTGTRSLGEVTAEKVVYRGVGI